MPIQCVQQPCKRWQVLLAARHPDDLSPSEHAALIQHLVTCSTCANVKADYDILTQHIRALPMPAPQSLPQFAMQQETKAMHDSRELDPIPFAERVYSTPRRSRFTRAMNTIAAALLFAVLIGSSLFLFSHRPGATGGTPTEEPTHLVPQSLHSCLSDPGLESICTKGYYKLVHITQKFNGPQNFTLTINRLYADSNRIVIGYTLLDSHGKVPDGLLDRSYNVSLWISSLNGNPHPIMLGQTDGFYGIEGSEGSVNIKTDIKKFTGMMFTTFDEPQYLPYAQQQISANTKELSLHLQAALYQTSPAATPVAPGVTAETPIDLGRAYFDVSMPFHQGYVLHPHATLAGQGVSDLSIDYIVVSLSETYIQLQGNKTVTELEDHSKTVETTLNVGGTQNYVGWDGWPNGNTYYESLFQEPLFDTHGTWKLQIKLHDSMGSFSGKVIKDAVFTFTNPGPS